MHKVDKRGKVADFMSIMYLFNLFCKESSWQRHTLTVRGERFQQGVSVQLWWNRQLTPLHSMTASRIVGPSDDSFFKKRMERSTWNQIGDKSFRQTVCLAVVSQTLYNSWRILCTLVRH